MNVLKSKRPKSAFRRFGRVLLVSFAILGVGVLVLTGILFWQAQQRPTGTAQYVALGSSFAAGIGLGKRIADSPWVCQRTVNSYPQQLARSTGLSLTDLSCSGATATHLLNGGQMFLGPQIDGLAADTELVTMTIGGNDISYVGDLTFLAGRKSASLLGRVMRLMSNDPAQRPQRDYAALEQIFAKILREIRNRSPRVQIVVVTYPVILPPAGTCPKLALTEVEAAEMRVVGERLAGVTRKVAQQEGATLIDMQRLGVGHDACSASPWVNGWVDPAGTPFHPTLSGAKAIAEEIAKATSAQAKK